jgi:hypothetical protein
LLGRRRAECGGALGSDLLPRLNHERTFQTSGEGTLEDFVSTAGSIANEHAPRQCVGGGC